MKGFEGLLVSYLLNSFWQAPLLLAAGWLAARLTRALSAEAEHRVSVSVLLLQCLLPAVCCLPAAWFEAFARLWHDGRGAADGSVTVQLGAGVLSAPRQLSPAWLTAIAIAYGALSAFFAVRLLWRCAQVANLRRSSQPVALDAQQQQAWSACASRFQADGVALRSSSRIFAPITIGARRPSILLPEHLLGALQMQELRTVVAHELAHIQRSDFLKNFAYHLLSVPVAYHPAVWIAHERVTESREIVCDRIAAGMGGPMAYGRSLLKLASLLLNGSSPRLPQAIGIFDSNTLERRIMQLKQKPLPSSSIRRALSGAAAVAVLIAVCASSMALGARVEAAGIRSDESSSASSARKAVPAGEMAGMLVNKVTPKYPQEAKKARIQGVVVLDAVINKSGAIENLVVKSGPKELQQSALDAVRQWTYRPYLIKGQPVEVSTTINVTYSLAK